MINVIETIRHCNNNNISGAVVAVDMAKAFDTLSHKFLEEVFKFFKMGPYIRKWLKMLGTGRTACIILDDCSYSRNFSLGRGAAQGDNISPDCFNFGDQILIFRIELDPNISGVWQNFQIPPPNPAPVPEIQDEPPNDPISPFSCESRRETGKNESLADDNTSIMLQTSENYRHLRRILEDFEAVSGLACNYDKTCVLPIGPLVPNLDLAGFTITESIKLLGFNVTKNFENSDDTFVQIHEKIKGLISFWERFRLSLPGRISVIKNLLIPQINYLGSILSPSDRVLSAIQDSLDAFALNGINCAKERRYLSPENGGLGLFDLKIFLDAQRCSWLKRADKLTIDNWRFDLKCKAPNGDFCLLRKIDISANENPILANIVDSFCNFSAAFAKKDSNYLKSPIFMNPVFVRSKDDSGLLDIPFFTRQVYDDCKLEIRSLTFKNCFLDGNFKIIDQFRTDGIRLTNVIWTRLRNAVTFAKKTLSKRENITKDCIELKKFIRSFKKGSKKFRAVLTHNPSLKENRAGFRTVGTFSNLTVL